MPQRLAAGLNAQSLADPPVWTAWDRELIEKVAIDYHIPMPSIEKVEQSRYSLLDTFISGLGGMPEELAILHRVQESVRALATSGHVILVGHGSVFMTRDIPGGVYIRLVTPLHQRIETMAHRMNVSRQEAFKRLQQSERNWRGFLRRYWPTYSLAPEAFTATFNTAQLDEDHLVRCSMALVT